MDRPLILVTNDDGINAAGIHQLIEIAEKLGDVYVVAPNKPQSGTGHAITTNTPLYCDELVKGKEWACSGTPVDAVKIAINKLLPKHPDLCISGINHGANSSISVLYSGTMSAAIEAGIHGIPAIGFSLCDTSNNANFSEAKEYIHSIILQVLQNNLPKGVVLNVNIPKKKKSEIKGIKICRQANARWEEKFDERTNPNGKTYYWLTGELINSDTRENADVNALEEGYISIVPVQFDLTAHQFINELSNWKF